MLTTTQSYVTYQGNGTTTAFPYPFPVAEAAFLQVSITNNNVSPPVTTVLSPSQYSVTGIGNGIAGFTTASGTGIPGNLNPPGGVVTYANNGTPLASGWTITIQRIVPYQQDTTLQNQGGFYPQVVEAALDDVVMQTQQLAAQVTNLQAQINQLAANEGVVNTLAATIQLPVSFTANSATQSLSSLSTTYLTANTQGTTFTTFTNLTKGHNFKIIVADPFTSIQFSNWSAGLGAGMIVGHKGQLINFVEGDILTCVTDGTYVYAIDSELIVPPPILSPCGGLAITNNSSAPNTELNIYANSITMANVGAGENLCQTWFEGPGTTRTPFTLNASTLGPGGMDTGSLAANTWYYIWAIGNGALVNVLLSAASAWSSVNQTNIGGYDYARLLGAVLTDAYGSFIKSGQTGNRFFFNAPQQETMTAPSPLANITPTVAPQGHLGTNTYSYAVIGVDVNGGTTEAVAVTTTQGNLTLSDANYNQISWTSDGASTYTIYRTASNGSPSITGVIASGLSSSTSSFDDTGLPGDGTTAPSSNTTAAGFVPLGTSLLYPVMIGATALLAVEELQASVNSGFVSVSADGFTPYFFIAADSGGPPISTQFEVPLTFGTLWTSFSNVPATSLLFRGFTFNL